MRYLLVIYVQYAGSSAHLFGLACALVRSSSFVEPQPHIGEYAWVQFKRSYW